MTGSWVGPTDLADQTYWSQHARNTVRFADAVEVLLADRPGIVLMEVGPGETLASLVRQQPGAASSAVFSTLAHRAARSDDMLHARRALGDAWTAGVDVDWSRLSDEGRRRVPLPTYPFARERYWLEGRPHGMSSSTDAASAAAPPVDTPAAPASIAQSAAMADVPFSAGAPSPVTTSGSGTTGTTNGISRRDRIAAMVAATLADVGGVDRATLDTTATFADLGFDSLTLTQVNAQLRKQFGVRVTLGQLLGETPTLAALADRIDAELAPDALGVPQASPMAAAASPLVTPGGSVVVVPSAPGRLPGSGTAADQVEWLIMEQLRIMDEQLDLLGAGVAVPGSATAATPEP
jgi:acyl transferase domain-containing protein